MDESGFHTSMTRLRARAPRESGPTARSPEAGPQSNAHRLHHPEGAMGQAVSIEGATDSELFETYVERFLAPTLSPAGGVLDGLGAHRTPKVRESSKSGAPTSVPASLLSGPQSHRGGLLQGEGHPQEGRARTRGALDEAMGVALSAVTPETRPAGSPTAATVRWINRYEYRCHILVEESCRRGATAKDALKLTTGPLLHRHRQAPGGHATEHREPSGGATGRSQACLREKESTNGHTKPVAAPELIDNGLSDDEIIQEGSRGFQRGEVLPFVERGHGGYGSHSEADLALCGMLAFWTGGDATRIDSLFRQSGLYREKWDRKDYRNRTITEALSGKTEFYKAPKTVKLADGTERKIEELQPEEIGKLLSGVEPEEVSWLWPSWLALGQAGACGRRSRARQERHDPRPCSPRIGR